MEAKTFFDGAVTVDPEIMHGTPVFSGTRVPIENLFEFITAGEDLAEFHDAFPTVNPDDVLKFLVQTSSMIRREVGQAA